MSSKAPFHNQCWLRNWANDQEATQWFSRPDLVFLLSYVYHNMHGYPIFAGLKYNKCGYFTSCLKCFGAQKDKRRQLARFLLLPSNKRYIIPLLLFLSNMRPRSSNHLPHFLNSIDTRKICFYYHTFFYNCSTFNNSAISTAKYFIFHTRLFYLHVLAELLYALSILLIFALLLR